MISFFGTIQEEPEVWELDDEVDIFEYSSILTRETKPTELRVVLSANHRFVYIQSTIDDIHS